MRLLTPGTTINGRYKVLREIGQGGVGRVYLVEDAGRDRQRLALKTLLPDTGNMRSAEKFFLEFAGLTRLRHPNISSACDFGRVAGSSSYFFTTEYVDGVDLYSGTADAELPQLVDLIAQTLRGLEFIHSHGFLHNDLKPSNILIEKCASPAPSSSQRATCDAPPSRTRSLGRVKIIDFGLFTADKTAWVDLLGTPQFLSPERIQGVPTDRRSDLYSLGVIVYLLLARQFPFEDSDTEVILREQLVAAFPSIATLRPNLPPPLVDLTAKLLQKLPEDRFQSAAEALRFLEREVDGNEEAAGKHRPAGLVTGGLIEREKELISLEESFCTACAMASETSAVIVEGPEGVGKTRLVGEMRGVVQMNLGVFLDVQLAAGRNDLAKVSEAVVQGLRMHGVSVPADLADALAGLPSGLRDAGDAQWLLESLLLRQAERAPMLFHIDNFQEAADDVRAFAGRLLQAARKRLEGPPPKPKILIVLSGRGPLLAPDGVEAGSIAYIDVRPFDDEGARGFLRQVFEDVELPEHVVDAVVQCARGFPKRMLELASDLVDQERVQFTGSKWVCAT